MTQYMLSVYMEEGTPMPSGDDMQRMFDQVDVFNAKVQKDGTKVISKFARVYGLDAGEKGRLLGAPFLYSTIKAAVFAATPARILPVPTR